MRTTPIGLWLLGIEYLECAVDLTKSSRRHRFDAPVYFLFGHGIELTLKACIHRSRSNLKELRSIGHNLDAALDMLDAKARRFLNLSDRDVELVQAINGEYTAKEFEYLKTGAVRRVPLPEYVELAERLIGLERSRVIAHFLELNAQSSKCQSSTSSQK